jgi:sulfotransferase family protein
MSVIEQSNEPIFIVGAPRSGTTLLRNMLNRHPDIAICRETVFFHYVYRRRRTFGSLRELRNRRRLVQEYLSTQRIQVMQMDSQALEATLLREGTSYPAFFAALLRFYAKVHAKRRCGEKTPRHALFTETLCQWYPGARIIHLLRDPRDVVASLVRMPWADHNALGNARLWLRCNLAAHRSRHRPQYMVVRYEDLVTNPERELSRVCAFVGEEYSPAMLAPNPDGACVAPWYQRAEAPLTAERMGSWRERLTVDEASLVEWFVGRHMQTFGYQAVSPPPGSWSIIRDLAATVVQAAERRAGEFPAVWYSFVRSGHLVKEEDLKDRFRNAGLNSLH